MGSASSKTPNADTEQAPPNETPIEKQIEELEGTFSLLQLQAQEIKRAIESEKELMCSPTPEPISTKRVTTEAQILYQPDSLSSPRKIENPVTNGQGRENIVKRVDKVEDYEIQGAVLRAESEIEGQEIQEAVADAVRVTEPMSQGALGNLEPKVMDPAKPHPVVYGKPAMVGRGVELLELGRTEAWDGELRREGITTFKIMKADTKSEKSASFLLSGQLHWLLVKKVNFENIRPVQAGFRRVLRGRQFSIKTVDTYHNSHADTVSWRVLKVDWDRLRQQLWGLVEFQHMRFIEDAGRIQ